MKYINLHMISHRMGCQLHDHGHSHQLHSSTSSRRNSSDEESNEVEQALQSHHSHQNMNGWLHKNLSLIHFVFINQKLQHHFFSHVRYIVRAAFIHVVSDFVQSCGVFLAAVVLYFKPEWKVVDPICTFIFSILVLFTTLSIMKDAILVSLWK